MGGGCCARRQNAVGASKAGAGPSRADGLCLLCPFLPRLPCGGILPHLVAARERAIRDAPQQPAGAAAEAEQGR